MLKLLIIITCAVVLTAHWGTFKDEINIDRGSDIIATIIQKIKE